MKKLDTYLYREMVVPFLIGTLAVVMMFQINTYMALAKTLNLENVPFKAVLQYILYKTPEFLQMTLPVGMSLAASLAITRLARESELTAMRAAGIPILRVIRPVALFGLAVSALNFYDVEYVMPKATGKANTLAYEAGILGMSKQSFKANSLIELDHQAAYFGAVTRTADNKLTIDGITLFDRKDSDVIFITTADSATYDRGVWTFKNGYLYQFRGADMTSLKAKGDFVINERIVVGSLFENTAPEEMSPAVLQRVRGEHADFGQTRCRTGVVCRVVAKHHLCRARVDCAEATGVKRVVWVLFVAPVAAHAQVSIPALSAIPWAGMPLPSNPLAPTDSAPLPPRDGTLPPPEQDKREFKLIRSGTFSQRGNRLSISGGTEFLAQGYRVFADTAEGDLGTNIWNLTGHVKVVGSGSVVNGERVTADLANRSYRAYDANTQLSPSLIKGQIKSDLYTKGRESFGTTGETRTYDGSVTTCDKPEPHFELEADDTVVRPGRRAIFRRAHLKVFGHTVLAERTTTCRSLGRVGTRGTSSRIGLGCR